MMASGQNAINKRVLSSDDRRATRRYHSWADVMTSLLGELHHNQLQNP